MRLLKVPTSEEASEIPENSVLDNTVPKDADDITRANMATKNSQSGAKYAVKKQNFKMELQYKRHAKFAYIAVRCLLVSYCFCNSLFSYSVWLVKLIVIYIWGIFSI